MSTTTLPVRATVYSMLSAWAGSRWLWCVAATAFVVFRDIAPDLADLRQSLGDTDDATRLVQVRSLLGGAGWFDPTLHRIGFPDALVSHWSRLIDLPIALLLLVFGVFLSAPTAEMLVRILWPALLLLVFLRFMVRETDLRGGAAASALFLVLAVTCLSGLFQFRAGRIDHHNAMILGTVVGLLALVRSIDSPRAG